MSDTAAKQSKAMTIGGWVMSALPILLLAFSGAMKLSQKPDMVAMFTGKFGYPAETLVPIGVVELLCVVLYAVPATSLLGAVVMVGYLGGAVATHVRVHDPFLPPLLGGMLAVGGLWLRDPRLRALLPLYRKQ